MLIAQLSDPHVVPRDDENADLYCTADRLEEAVAHVNSSENRPDLVFITGDLVNTGSREEYLTLKKIIAKIDFPTYLLAGNHDDCDHLRETLPEHDYLPKQGPLCYVVEGWPLKLIVLDTNLPKKPQGHLGQEQIAWLDNELEKETTRNVIIFMHHPPFNTGLTSMDEMGLEDAEAFGAVIARHDHVERILCGHLHRAIQKLYHGTLAQTCPSTSHQVSLLLGKKNKLGTMQEPPEYLLHYWTKTDGLVTHTDYVKRYPVIWTQTDGVL